MLRGRAASASTRTAWSITCWVSMPAWSVAALACACVLTSTAALGSGSEHDHDRARRAVQSGEILDARTAQVLSQRVREGRR